MKTWLSFMVFMGLCIMLSTGCAKASSNTTTVSPAGNEIIIAANSDFDLPVGKKAILKGEDISIEFYSVIADSRCPTGVTCIWAGEARCKVLVSQKGQTEVVILIQSGSAEGTGVIGGYQVSFHLKPYPEHEILIGPMDYVLVMRIIK